MQALTLHTELILYFLNIFLKHGIDHSCTPFIYIDFNAHDNNEGLLLIFNVVGHQFYETNMDLFKFGDGQLMLVLKNKQTNKQIDRGIFDLLFTKVKKNILN